MSDLTKAVLTILILGISWGLGKWARSRTAPQKRQAVGLGVIFVFVIPIILINAQVQFAPRSELRSMLILFCLGWITGLFRRTRSDRSTFDPVSDSVPKNR